MRELRLIAAHRPRYNRRSRNPHATWWVDDRRPRRSRGCRWSSTPREGALGPFRSQRDAREAVDTVLDAVPLRAVHAAHPGARGGRRARARLHELQPLRRAVRRAAGRRRVRARASAAWRDLVDGADDGPLHALADEVADASRRGSGSRRPLAGATGSPPSSGRWAACSG